MDARTTTIIRKKDQRSGNQSHKDQQLEPQEAKPGSDRCQQQDDRTPQIGCDENRASPMRSNRTPATSAKSSTGATAAAAKRLVWWAEVLNVITATSGSPSRVKGEPNADTV
jgi:hypothetical protein